MNLKKLYYQILRIRLIEERIADEYAKQEMRCPVHFCIGHEAIPVGVCACLSKNDYVFSNHRSHGHYLAKGGDLGAMIAEIYGKETGCSMGRGGSQHLIDQSVGFLGATPIVGGTIPVAVGSAFATTLKGPVTRMSQTSPQVARDKTHTSHNRLVARSPLGEATSGSPSLVPPVKYNSRNLEVTVVFFGDAATEEGVFHESLNFASLKKLPVLFVCENNFYSIFTHISNRQPKRDIARIAAAHGIFSIKEDGNDVVKVYNAAQKALFYIKSGKGPAFLEFTTYRFREHCGPNFENPGERPVKEFEKWTKRDPLNLLEKRGLREKWFDKKAIEKMKKAIQKEIDKAFDFARESPYLVEDPEEKKAFK